MARPARERIAGLIAIALTAAGCGGKRAPAEQRAREAAGKGDIVIAAVWPWQRHGDIRYLQGLEMAIDEVNAGAGINGRPVRLQRHDDEASLDRGTMIAQQISADPRVMAVVGHLQSYVTAPAAAVYDLAGLVMVAPAATDPALTSHGYTRVFRATFTDRDTGRQLAEFARTRFRRVAICYIRNTYGRGLANAFEERANEIGLVIAARQSYDPSEQVRAQTFSRVVQEWKSLELDAIFLAGEVPSAGLFVLQARTAGLDVPILGGDAMSGPALITTAGRAAEGTIVTSFFHPDEPRPEVQRFKAAFEKRYGQVPDAGSAIGYDVIQLLARAMRHAGTPAPDQVARALHELPIWNGITGSFQFNQQGAAVSKRVVMMTVRDGRFVYLDGYAPASGTEPPPSETRQAPPRD